MTSEVSDLDVAKLNTFQVHSADENVYFNDWNKAAYVENIVRRSIRRRIQDPIRVEEFVADEVDTRTFSIQYERLPGVLVDLSFVRLTDEARKESFRDRMRRSNRHGAGVEIIRESELRRQGERPLFRRQPAPARGSRNRK